MSRTLLAYRRRVKAFLSFCPGHTANRLRNDRWRTDLGADQPKVPDQARPAMDFASAFTTPGTAEASALRTGKMSWTISDI